MRSPIHALGGLTRLLQADLVLLHPPAVYDFRNTTSLFGPVSDAVPSTQVFEMYPVGFTSIGERLEREGFNVRIVNLAYRMLRDADYDAEGAIAALDPLMFGIDLHWLVHAHGALEIAKLVKRLHPMTPMVLGGLSASYYHRELIERPEVDLVMRGDSTEEAMVTLMRAVASGGSLAAVPNLTWKAEHGRAVENAGAPSLPNLNGTQLPDFRFVIRSVMRHRSLADAVPYAEWPRFPMTGLLTSRGCVYDCAICGGGRSAARCISAREHAAFASPESLVEGIRSAARLSRAPIILLNDIRMGGARHVGRFFELMQAAHIQNEIVFELFSPPPKEFFRQANEALSNYSIEMSLESHRRVLRRKFGKFPVSNEAIERALADALSHGVRRADVFFMVGLPGQTYDDAVGVVDYCRHLWEETGNDGRVQFFITPLTPFLDPGSPAFEHPERHGYRVRYRTLEEHRRALTAPSWKQMLNYETDAMSADEIVEATYECYVRLARLKLDFGRIDLTEYGRTLRQVEQAREAIAGIDDALRLPQGAIQDHAVRTARQRIVDLTHQKGRGARDLRWLTNGWVSAPWATAGLVIQLAGQEAWRLLTKRVPLLWGGRRAYRDDSERVSLDEGAGILVAGHGDGIQPHV